jgi:hypothetical protein
LQFNPDDKSWSCLGKEGEEANSPNVRTKDAIITFLRQRQGIPYEAAEIHNAIGGSLGHVRRSAYDLAEEGVISRRQHQLGGAYTYFVGRVIMDDQPTITHDHPPITPNDHPKNPGVASLSAEGDRVITKNVVFSTEIEQEEVRSHDQPITLPEEKAENIDTARVSLPEEGVIAPVIVRSEELRSHDQPITQHNQPVEVITATKPRKPTVNDRVKHFGGKCGTILAINKGLAKYEIQWDGGKTEVYSQKEFNKFDFEILSQSLNPEKKPLVTSQQVQLPLEESWEKYYRKFKIVCQKVVDGFGYFATVFHPSGAQVELQVPAIDAHSANEWIEQVLDQELLE